MRRRNLPERLMAPLGLSQALAVGGTPPTIFSGAKVTGFTAANFLSAPPLSFPGFGTNKCLVLLLSIDAPSANGADYQGILFAGTAPGGNVGAAGDRGFILYYNSNQLAMFSMNNGLFDTWNIGALQQGLNAIVLWNDGVNYNVVKTAATNGYLVPGPLAQHAPTTTALPPDAGSTFNFGLWTYPTGPNFYSGGLLHFVALSRSPVSTAEAQSWVQAMCPTSPANRFQLPASLTGDPSVTVDFLPARDFNASAPFTTRGSAPLTITPHGALTLPTLKEQVYTVSDLVNSFVNTGQKGISSGHIVTDALARLAFTSPASQAQVGFAHVNTDPTPLFSNYEESGLRADGAWVTALPNTETAFGPLGVPTMFWAALGAGSAAQTAHAVEYVAPAQISSPPGSPVVGGWCGGAQLAVAQSFTTTPPAKIVVAYGDSTQVGYYVIYPGEFGLVAELRASYAGGIDCYAYGGRRLYDDTAGGTNVIPLANAIVARAQNVAPGGVKSAYLPIGINDYLGATPGWTAAAFGTTMGALCDAIHAEDPTIHIFVQEYIQSFYYATANANGDTLGAYNTSVANVAAARPGVVTCLNPGAAWNIPTSDNVHPTQPGYATWAGLVLPSLP